VPCTVMSAVVYCKRETEFSLNEVEKLLCEVDPTRVSNQTAQKPKGGEVYIYHYQYGTSVTKLDWVADGYRWLNVGCDRLPRREPVMYKRKFQIVKSGGSSSKFKRVAYSKIGASEGHCTNHYVLVHYIGNETVAEDLPHGNVKNRKQARPFYRAAPSIIAHRTARVKEQQSAEQHHFLATAADNVRNQPHHLTEF